jgi:hypothetical protein
MQPLVVIYIYPANYNFPRIYLYIYRERIDVGSTAVSFVNREREKTRGQCTSIYIYAQYFALVHMVEFTYDTNGGQ